MPRHKPEPPPHDPHGFVNTHRPVLDPVAAAALVAQMNEELRVFERDALHETHWDPVTGRFRVEYSGTTSYLTHIACRRCARVLRTSEFPSKPGVFVDYQDHCYDCHEAVTGKSIRPGAKSRGLKITRIAHPIIPATPPQPFVDTVLPGIIERLGPGLRKPLSTKYRREHEGLP